MKSHSELIASACEKMLTLAKRDCRSNDDGQLREKIKDRFLGLCSELGKIATRLPEGADWAAGYASIDDLHTAACNDMEMAVDQWRQAGSINLLSGQLASTAAVLGFTLEPIDAAQAEVEGHQQRTAAE